MSSNQDNRSESEQRRAGILRKHLPRYSLIYGANQDERLAETRSFRDFKDGNIIGGPPTEASNMAQRARTPEVRRLSMFEKLPFYRVVSFGYEGQDERLRKIIRARLRVLDDQQKSKPTPCTEPEVEDLSEDMVDRPDGSEVSHGPRKVESDNHQKKILNMLGYKGHNVDVVDEGYVSDGSTATGTK